MLGGVPLIYEEFVAFDCEVSIIGARSRRGEVAIYPLNLNQHRAGILRVTRAPWHHAALQRRAAQYLRRVLRHFGYAGVLTIEFFVTRGRLIANEMAPRVHNSGHWTIEGAVTSQFENHVRAVLDLPLGSPAPRADCAMVNLIGALPERRRLLGQPDLHFHDYGKSARPGRKLGHVTLLDGDRRRLDRRVTTLLRQIDPDTRLESRFLT
jgi:5-(carboxyamino)imidazole ribonucleotide synthase